LITVNETANRLIHYFNNIFGGVGRDRTGAFSFRVVYKTDKAFQLRYSATESVKLFKFMYNRKVGDLYMKRKFNVFRKYFDLKPEKINSVVKTILHRFLAT